MDRDQADREIERSRMLLIDRVGCDVNVFAYPYGTHNAVVRELAQRVYAGACGARLDWARTASDCYNLPRIDAYYLRYWSAPTLLESSIGGSYVALRRAGRALRRWRRWGEVTDQ